MPPFISPASGAWHPRTHAPRDDYRYMMFALCLVAAALLLMAAGCLHLTTPHVVSTMPPLFPHAQPPERPHVRLVIGVMTTLDQASQPHGPHVPEKFVKKYNYTARREQLSQTWMPYEPATRRYLEEELGIVIRYVIGRSSDEEQGVTRDISPRNPFDDGLYLHVPSFREHYGTLVDKTLAFLQAATQLWRADYIVKADDDLFLRLDSLLDASYDWEEQGDEYIGCMKTGGIITDPNYRWYEPQHHLFGGSSNQHATYPLHAWGSLYVLKGRLAETLAAYTQLTTRDDDRGSRLVGRMHTGEKGRGGLESQVGAPSLIPLRHLRNEDVTIGIWMLAFNVQHRDDRRLCRPVASVPSCIDGRVAEEDRGKDFIAIYDWPTCAGFCDAVKSLSLLPRTVECLGPRTVTEWRQWRVEGGGE